MNNELEKNKLSPRRRLVNFLVHLLLAILAIIWVLPMLARSLPVSRAATSMPSWFTMPLSISWLRLSAAALLC